jgi:hypothetical protein
MSESLQALRRANPRARARFERSVEAAAEVIRAQIASAPPLARSRRRRNFVGIAAVGSAALAAGTVLVLIVASPGGGPGVQNADAAVKRAANVTAASAERSGTAVVGITHNGELWAGVTVRWNSGDLSISRGHPQRNRRPGSALLVVDGVLYGVDERDGGWVDMGRPASIDPGSGTTPAEYLAAVREDIGGVTLRRIADGMAGATASSLGSGATVYRGTVAAGLIARESGFKEGQRIRVLPFGFVAHGDAADPMARLTVAVTVDAGGVVEKIDVEWNGWRYEVAYSRLGATPPIAAPKHARSLLEERRR